MTTFAPDLPDWTSSTTGGQVYTDFQTATQGEQVLFTLTGVSSLVINIAAFNDNDDIRAAATFYPPGAFGFGLAVLAILCAGNSTGAANVSMELPAYGAQMVVLNNFPTNPIDIGVVTSNRSVETPKFLNPFNEGMQFLQSGPFVAGTKQVLQFIYGGNSGWLSNGPTTVVVTSSDAGVLYFRQVDIEGTVFDVPIATVAAGSDQVFTPNLPQCGGSIVFKPTTSNAGGTITAFLFGP